MPEQLEAQLAQLLTELEQLSTTGPLPAELDETLASLGARSLAAGNEALLAAQNVVAGAGTLQDALAIPVPGLALALRAFVVDQAELAAKQGARQEASRNVQRKLTELGQYINLLALRHRDLEVAVGRLRPLQAWLMAAQARPLHEHALVSLARRMHYVATQLGLLRTQAAATTALSLTLIAASNQLRQLRDALG